MKKIILVLIFNIVSIFAIVGIGLKIGFDKMEDKIVCDKPTEELQENETTKDDFEDLKIEQVTIQLNEIWKVSSCPVPYIECELDTKYQDFVWVMCQKYEIDFYLVMALMKIESDYSIDKISVTDDYGLMQINKINHKYLSDTLGITDFLDPYENIKAGTFMLNGLLEATDGNIQLALMSYNMGYERAKLLWKYGEYGTKYSQKVIQEYERLKGM